ncbi:TetR/AcrR family transcriptional regulator [Acidimicrobiaceae bacterium AH-315-P05]|nr:TetR/AcrR family transcriptional regulator [Acidimicrobiaceae bacterium AH-315-P05]
MGRRPKYSPDQILDAAASLLADDGPHALSVARIAGRLGAPSGSIYHRFGSRDVLVASLWLRVVEDFQEALSPAFDEPDPHVAVRALARRILDWARSDTQSAQLLMLHRSTDLIDGEWPADLVARNREQIARVEQMIGVLGDRLGATSLAERRRVVFAVVDIPYGAVRSALGRGEAPGPELDAIVDDAVVAVLNPLKIRKDTT